MIGVHEIPAGFAYKLMLTTTTDFATNRTGFTGICRINKDNGDASLFGFVSDFRSQIVESPTAKHFTHSLAFRGSLTNTSQVFECNCNVGGFGFLDDFFADYVIDIVHHPSLLAAKPFQGAFAALCAFFLQARFSALAHFTQSVQLATGNCFSGRKSSDAIDSQINAKGLIRLALRRLGDFNHKVNVKSLFLLVVNEVSRCRFLAFQKVSLVIAKLQFDFLTTFNRGNRNRLGLRNEAEQVFIKIKRRWAKFFRRPFLAERPGDAANCSDDVVRCQTSCGFDMVVAETVNIEGSFNVVLLSDLQRPITGVSEHCKRGLKRLRLLLTWNQLCRYSLLHRRQIYHPHHGI